jgi:hypothetical protein
MQKFKFKPGPKLADLYLDLKARQAALAKEEEALKLAILSMGQPVIEGELARVTVSEAAGRVTFDADLLRAHVPAATLRLCTNTGKPSVRFAVKAKLSSPVPIAA